MDLIFDNPLANLYGPYFLILYAVFIVTVAVAFGIAKRAADQSDRLPIPSIQPDFDPFEAGFLRGGENELARMAVLSLIKKEYLTIQKSGSAMRIKRTGKDASPMLSRIEADALAWIGTERSPAEIFKRGGLPAELAPHSRGLEQRLGQMQLINTAANRAAFVPYRIAGFLAVIGLGAYKFAAALVHGRSNLFFLFLLGIAGIIAVHYKSKLPWQTKLGSVFLERLRIAFGSPPPAALAGAQTGAAGADPLMLSVGVLGTGVLAGTMYSEFNEAFRKAQNSAACGTGCGSSSCSSGDGGSSCGGGCGGCGGGD